MNEPKNKAVENDLPVFNGLKWLIAIVFIIIGLANFKRATISAIFFLLAGFVCSPLYKKTGVFRDKPMALALSSFVLTLCFLFMGFLVSSISSDKTKSENSQYKPPKKKVSSTVEEAATEPTTTTETVTTTTESTTVSETTTTEIITTVPETEPPTPAPTEPKIEMNSLQTLFASLNANTTREQIDIYITNNNLLKYAFTHDSAYYIGYTSDSIRERGRDRIGEAIDVDFFTSGDINKIGMVNTAKYAIHHEATTSDTLKFENGLFYYKNQTYSSGEEAMQKFLADNT